MKNIFLENLFNEILISNFSMKNKGGKVNTI